MLEFLKYHIMMNFDGADGAAQHHHVLYPILLALEGALARAGGWLLHYRLLPRPQS